MCMKRMGEGATVLYGEAWEHRRRERTSGQPWEAASAVTSQSALSRRHSSSERATDHGMTPPRKSEMSTRPNASTSSCQKEGSGRMTRNRRRGRIGDTKKKKGSGW